MLVPIRLADPQGVTGAIERRLIAGFVRGIGHFQGYIDGWFGRKAGHRRRSGMFQTRHLSPKCGPDSVRFTPEQFRPSRIVIDNLDAVLTRHGRRGFRGSMSGFAKFVGHALLELLVLAAHIVFTESGGIHDVIAAYRSFRNPWDNPL